MINSKGRGESVYSKDVITVHNVISSRNKVSITIETQTLRLDLTLNCDVINFPGSASGKEPTCQCRRCKTHGFDP